jgi:hypothetical protein
LGVVHAQHARDGQIFSINHLKHLSKMKAKAFVIKVTLVTGIVLTCSGIGENKDQALMDACMYLSQTDYPQDDILDVDVIDEEEQA